MTESSSQLHPSPSLRSSNSGGSRDGAQSNPSSNESATSSMAYLQGKASGSEEAMAEILLKASQQGEMGTIKLILGLGRDLSKIRSLDSNLGPLHYASREGHKDAVDLLLAEKFSPFAEDQYGNTALHLAASNGHLEIVAGILAHESRCNREVSESQHTNLLHRLNKDALSPLGCALRSGTARYNVAKYFLSNSNGNPPDGFPDFGKAYLSSYTESFLDKPVKIFVVGDQGAGKSTLTKALQESRSVLSRLTFGLAATGRRIRSSEDKHFTGVIATDFYSPNSKRVMFYDLAGHTNYFNRALVEPVEDIPQSVFIVVISLKNGSTKVKQRLVFWLNFLYHHLCRSPQEDEGKPSVIVLGSHYDSRPSRRNNIDNERLLKVFTGMQQESPALANSFSFILKPLSLDCRKFQTSDMCYLRNHLYRTCLKLAPAKPLPACTCYVLSSLFNSKDFANLPALTVGNLASMIKTNSSKHASTSLYHLLPEEPSDLLDLCKELHSHERILLFSNPTQENYAESTWIVHDSHLILTAIDRQLASLNSPEAVTAEDMDFFKDIHEKFLFSMGIATRETLDRALSGLRSSEGGTFILDINLTMHLLQYFKYTEQIEASSPDIAFFFPALLPLEVGEPDNWEGNGFGFALGIRAPQDKSILTYFLPRFLKKLLLRLTQQFILLMGHKLPVSLDEHASQSSEIENSVVWSRGLSWQAAGLRVYIVTNDSAIILNMYCEQEQEMRCIGLRNEIVRTIHEERRKWQDTIETETFLLPFKDKMLPVESFETSLNHWIPLKEMYNSLLEGKTYCKGISIDSLLFFEPAIALLKMLPSTLEFLSDNHNVGVIIGHDDMSNIYESFGSEREVVANFCHLPEVGKEAVSLSEGSSAPDLEAKPGDSLKCGISVDSVSPPTAALVEPAMELTEVGKELTCGQLLNHMDSLSVLDFMGFLNDIKDKPHLEAMARDTPSTDQRDDSVFDSDVQVDLARGGTLRSAKSPVFDKSTRCDRLYSIPHNQLPFVGSIKTLECTNTGGTFNLDKHSVSIVVPNGAVAKSVEVDAGILLTGPFKFPINTTQVSTILWLCARTKKSLKFTKPIEVRLSHFIDCSEQDEVGNLAFVRATHDSSLSDKPFVFSEVTDPTTFVNNKGSVFIKQCGFVSIVHKAPKMVLEKTNFFLVNTVPKQILESKFEMNFTVVYGLKTCIEAIFARFPDCQCKKQTFKFACDSSVSKPALQMHFKNRLKSGWVAGRTSLCSQIYASDVKLFVDDDEDDDESLSHFTIELLGTSATESDILYVALSGADRELELQKPLEPIGRITRAATLSSINSNTSTFMPLKILDRNITSIIQYLDIDYIRPVLMEQGTILPDEHDSLVKQSTSTDGSKKKISIEALVGMLRHKGCRGIRDFIQALTKTSNDCLGHGDIVEILKEDSDYDYINSFEGTML